MGLLPKLFSNAINVDDGQDHISNLPDVLTEKILELLPLSAAAKMGVLSKRWNKNWLGLQKLVFDEDFWKGRRNNNNGKLDWEEYNRNISNILLRHHGPIHEFHLIIPRDVIVRQETLNLNNWLSFLSRNSVRKITLWNLKTPLVPLASYIFSCMELQELILCNFILNPPPAEFEGFKNLEKLKLIRAGFKNDEVAGSLIKNCPKLDTLSIERCNNIKHLVIDAPRLKILTLSCDIGSIAFKNIRNLANLNLSLFTFHKEERKNMDAEIANAVENLGNSCELKSLHLGLNSTKFLAAGGIKKSLPVALTQLTSLSFAELDLGDFGVYSCIIALMQSCPFVKRLGIVVNTNSYIQHRIAYDKDYKLGHLLEVEFVGVTGSYAELKLIEYVLAVSNVLEKLFIVFRKDHDWSTLKEQRMLKVQTMLNQLRRASSKAQIVFPGKPMICKSARHVYYY